MKVDKLKRVNFSKTYKRTSLLQQIRDALKRAIKKQDSDDIQKMIDESW